MQKISSFIIKFCTKNYVSCTTHLKSVKYISSSTEIGLPNVEPADSGTVTDVSTKIREHLGLPHGYEKEPQKRDHLLKYTPKPEDLPPRTMADSYVKAIIPLSICKKMQQTYVTPIGTVRLGRLMEQLDLFAVWVCHQHVRIPKLPPGEHVPLTFVTVLVDKMTFSKLLPEYNQDIQISGFVSWVGKTSLEITIWLEQKFKDAFRLITQSVFLMAARNATNTKSAPINSLQLVTDREKEIFNLGEQRRLERKRANETSIFKIKPTENEHALMYNLFKNTTDNSSLRLNNRVLPADSQWMNKSFVSNTFISLPENSNAVNTIFGGFIMRQSFEISWICAYLHSGQRPSLLRSCDISFDKPVQISSFVKMTAYVVYTKDNLMQIMTIAEVLDRKTKRTVTTNTFNYTFSCAEKVTLVLPKSYQESLWYIHGKRKFEDEAA